MAKSTKLLIAALGLGGLGYFLYKKGLFSNAVATTPLTTPSVTPKTTLKNAPTCPSGYKLQMVDINCNGQDCEVHCVVIPPVPERKIMPIDVIETLPIDDVIKVQPINPVFKEVPNNPVIFYPYSDIPIEVVVNPYVGVPQNPKIQVTDNTFRGDVMVVNNDPFINTGRGKGSVNYELNQMLYL